MHHDKENKHIAEYEYSIGYRLTHWIRALSIVVLIASGYYISYVFQSPETSGEPVLFMQAKWRFVHLVFGFILIGVFVFKAYLFVFDRQSKKERISIKDSISPKIWFAQLKYYMFLGPHPHLKGVYNPLQFVSYFFFYIVLFAICLTGLVLYIHVYHNGLGGALYSFLRPVEVWMGGLANVREIHHICMLIMMIFVPVHVYMAIFNAIKGKDGSMDAIISGYKFPQEDHA